jgi:hypothetical protein
MEAFGVGARLGYFEEVPVGENGFGYSSVALSSKGYE